MVEANKIFPAERNKLLSMMLQHLMQMSVDMRDNG